MVSLRPRIVFRIASVCNAGPRLMTAADLVFEGRRAWNTRTDTAGDTLYANILKGIALVCEEDGRRVRTDWNLAAIIGQAPPPSLGT